jgi:hypothetical protein
MPKQPSSPLPSIPLSIQSSNGIDTGITRYNGSLFRPL